MKLYLIFFTLLLASSALAQEELISNRSANSVMEILDLPEITNEEQESSPLELLLEDVDDLTASFIPAENLEFYATASNLLDIEMTVDPYDEDQLVDITPKAIDETFPVEGSSRFISAGLRFTF